MARNNEKSVFETMTITDVCKVLNISRQSYYRSVASHINRVKVGRQVRILKTDLALYLSANRSKGVN